MARLLLAVHTILLAANKTVAPGQEFSADDAQADELSALGAATLIDVIDAEDAPQKPLTKAQIKAAEAAAKAAEKEGKVGSDDDGFDE